MRIHRLLDAEESGSDRGSAATRRERDRALGRRLADAGEAPSPLALLAAWCAEREADRRHGDDAMPVVTAVSSVLGVGLGVLAASGAFFYDGTARVNVLLLIGLFAALPAATLVLFAVACATRRGLRGTSPGRLGELAGRMLPWKATRELAGLAAGDHGPEVAKWLVLTWSQWFSLGFGVGALAAAVLLVVFTDLAFGWSTTLDVAPSSLHDMARILALPWRDVLPAAVPSPELVETSRYFRLAADVGVEEPQQLGGWWPFVIMTMLVYGTAPRLLTTLLARWRLAHACRRALLADPRVRLLVQRMTTPLVETRSEDAEATPRRAAGSADFGELPPAGVWQVVNWASVPVDRAALERLLAPARLLGVHDAGGARSTAADRDLARQLRDTATDGGILVIARGFDPPTLDLMDFLQDLREGVRDAVPVAILPMALVDGAPAPLAPHHAAAWTGTLTGDAAGDVRVIGVRPEPVP